MKKFKKLLAIFLVASMIFTTDAVNIFAEGGKPNQEEQLNEESEETTVGANEESVGAKLGEPEEDIDMDENLSEPEDDTRKGERLSEPALEEEPEAEAEEDLKLNDKKIDELYGDPAKTLLSIEVSKYTITTYYVGDTYDTTDLEIRAYYDDESYETISYTGNEDKFSFNPDYVQNPFTEATTEDEHLEMEMTYTESENSADATILLQVRETPSTDKKFYIVYYASDADFAYPPSIGTLSYDVVESADYFEPVGEWYIKYNTECLYEDGFIKVDKSLEETLNSGYDRNTFPTPKGTGLHPVAMRDVYNDWVNAGKTEDVVYGVLYCSYFYVSYLKSDGTIEMKKLMFTDDIELENLVNSDIWVETPDGKNLKGFQYWTPADYPNYDFTDAGEVNFYKNLTEDESKLLLYPDDVYHIKAFFDSWKQQDFNPQYHIGAIYDDGAYAVSITVTTNPDKIKYNVGEKFDPTGLIINVKYSDGNEIEVWYEDDPDEFIFSPSLNTPLTAGTTRVKLTFYKASTYINITVGGGGYSPSGGSSSSGGSDGGGASDPTHGPMGDLTKNPLYANALNNIVVNTANNIPQTSLLNNNGLYVQLKSMQENANTSFNNAKDAFGNTGYGQWLRVPNSTTWYFYAGDLNQVNGQQTQGFLSNGWFNLGWDGQDRWYHFDTNGVMQLGWYQEAGKTYFLQNDLNDNWYGKAVTGTQNIGGRVYNFDANGALIN